ncbi:MAG: hypothetical protein LBT54_08075 [Bifidobacteriaceae bacterium]|jgi:hypothetical protein|nr:hypothetical protein [Bifidobacteriaceae bacterium]
MPGPARRRVPVSPVSTVLALAAAGLLAAPFLLAGAPVSQSAIVGQDIALMVDSAAFLGSDANPGDGRCAASTGACTLRAAIEEANALGASNTVTVTVAPGFTGVIAGGGPASEWMRAPITSRGEWDQGAYYRITAPMSIDLKFSLRIDSAPGNTGAAIFFIDSPGVVCRGISQFHSNGASILAGPGGDGAANPISNPAMDRSAGPADPNSGGPEEPAIAVAVLDDDGAVELVKRAWRDVPPDAAGQHDAIQAAGVEVPAGATLAAGTALWWTYTVTNTGPVPLTNLAVTDSQIGPVCDVPHLAPGSRIGCAATGPLEPQP